MKHRHPIIIFLVLVVSSALASVGSYRTAATLIDADLQQALAQTLRQQRPDVITPDTIRTFNSHLQMEALRGEALLTLSSPDGHATIEARCPAAAMLRLSDQRPALALVSMAFVWAFGCRVRQRRPASASPSGLPSFGGLTLQGDRFFTVGGEEVKFTPMQRQLMAMFFCADGHRLAQSDICAALWPKKDDASETLYALIRRLKAVLEAQTGLTVVCDRSRAYTLEIKMLR